MGGIFVFTKFSNYAGLLSFCSIFIINRNPTVSIIPTGKQIQGFWTKPAKIYIRKEIPATVSA